MCYVFSGAPVLSVTRNMKMSMSCHTRASSWAATDVTVVCAACGVNLVTYGPAERPAWAVSMTTAIECGTRAAVVAVLCYSERYWCKVNRQSLSLDVRASTLMVE